MYVISGTRINISHNSLYLFLFLLKSINLMHMEMIKGLLWLTVFSIAMAFLESAVVIYLRELYYPEGFSFPLEEIEGSIALVEFLREAATMFMLLAVGVIIGRNALERFAAFIMAFAIWDIFYYVFLYVFLDWPQSIVEWDILFLIPVMWVGPVLGPVVNSMMMIILAMLIISFSGRNEKVSVGWIAWLLLIVGSIVVILSYTLDYIQYMQDWFSLSEIFFNQNSEKVMAKSIQYVPRKFNWYIYGLGIFMHLVAIVLVFQKNSKR